MEIKEVLKLNTNLSSSGRYVYNNHDVPRATEIISKMIHEDGITQWANSLGFKHIGYNKALGEAADYGTKAHKGIEYYLKNKTIPLDTPQIILDGFKLWWDKININNTISILGQEHKLVCEWYGGTYDLLMSVNGIPWLVDFKTSNHVTYKYFIQLAAYNRILRDIENIILGGVVILQLDKNKPKYTEYVLDLSNEGQRNYFSICERTFMGLLYSYYHIHYLEENLNENISKNSSNAY